MGNYTITNQLSGDFLLKLKTLREQAGYTDSNLFRYLSAQEFPKIEILLDVPGDELIFTLTLIKFNFLFKLNRSFPSRDMQDKISTKKSIISINNLLMEVNLPIKDSAKRAFSKYHKINIISNKTAEKDSRVLIYKTIDNFIFLDKSFKDLIKPIFKSGTIPENIASDESLDLFLLSQVKQPSLDKTLTKFLNVLFPPVAPYEELTDVNTKMIRHFRRKYTINKKTAHHVNADTERIQEYDRNNRLKFESDLNKFYSTYNVTYDYDQIFKKLQKK